MRKVIYILIFGLFLPGSALSAEPVPVAVSFQKMAGERHDYTLDFLVFKNLAGAHLQLTAEKEPGRYRAELVAHTLGVASWLSGDRTQRYMSVMEEDGTGRLRSVSHESAIYKIKSGKWTDKQKRYRFDYEAGKVYQEKGENGQFSAGLVFELPDRDAPVDILTGFYNLRAGVYGKLTPGTKLKIPTFTTKGISEIAVEVLDGAERLAHSSFPTNGILLRVKVDPEVFDTGESRLYAWFDESGRPAQGVVENVIGLGDVHGRLIQGQNQP